MVFFMSKNRAVIFVNGNLPDLEAARKILLLGDVFYAADAGASHLLRLGQMPEMVIGDLDSLPETEKIRLNSAGVRMVRYPQDKDLTDLELTINKVLEEGYRKLLIVAALGGRLDMTISNLNLLSRPDLQDIDVRIDDGIEEIQFVRGKAIIQGRVGDTVSLMPWGGVVEGVTTKGLRWPLKNARLELFETRTVSNEMIVEQVEIRVGSGALMCIHHRNL
jgi:thiamine pyrophosphokinase